AAEGWDKHLEGGGKMLLTMGGAMSTAEMGLSIAELIRQDKVHALCMTGANLEEDLFNLVAHNSYERIPHYRHLTAEEEVSLHERGLNRVTDTCIPEDEAIRKIEGEMLKLWQAADKAKERFFPYEFFYKIVKSKALAHAYQIDPKDAWLVAAAEKNIPIWTPGWEDSTLGNIFVASVIAGKVSNFQVVKSGLEQMESLVRWYLETDSRAPIGFFQIAGGIAGDFPICAVPLIRQDLQKDCRLWGYFCQISDSTTSFGSYSGAVPNEKITWGKLDGETPKFIIESDATIVFPLISAYVLDH
ncbi:MAG TPA: deoxyhypusine synthase family protein, partial [Myxococcota bacterium]|nr:deoxyhypusine synthase family protein [Myxococcota bacterium]